MSNSNVLSSAPPARASGIDRRVAVRAPLNLDTSCVTSVSPADEVCAGWVRDLSSSGIGVILEQNYAPGSWLSIELDNAACGATLRVRARVVHVIGMPNDSWLHGCAFERDLADDELRSFVD